MAPKEHLSDFYSYYGQQYLSLTNTSPNELAKQQFNVYRRGEFTCSQHLGANRRDFYKISLIDGEGVLYYADRAIVIDKPALLYSNPMIPYRWEATSSFQTGYFCVFTEAFVSEERTHGLLSRSPLFRIGGEPLYFVSLSLQNFISGLFEQMLSEIQSEYVHKGELFRNYVQLLIHEAFKMDPAMSYFQNIPNAASRISQLFLDLLERQFPIDSPSHRLDLKTASDFAQQLSVHPNHLNRALKEVVGKTTTQLIHDRISAEAKALLVHTKWNIAEIAWCLGFEEPAYFSNFMKKMTSMTPASIRQMIV